MTAAQSTGAVRELAEAYAMLELLRTARGLLQVREI
jgi:hypothetical protein